MGVYSTFSKVLRSFPASIIWSINANIVMSLNVLDVWMGMLFMYKVNNSGPNALPWGMHLVRIIFLFSMFISTSLYISRVLVSIFLSWASSMFDIIFQIFFSFEFIKGF